MSAELTHRIKALALETGFARAGIAPAGEVANHQALLGWLREGRNAGMAYMSRNLDLRLNPSRLMPGARSVICLAAAECVAGILPASEGARQDAGGTPATQTTQAPGVGRIARYARGRDYHKVLKRRCIAMMDAIRQLCPEFQGRAFVDSAPVMERSLAVLAGLGWIGRNGCLVVPGLGSHVLLCEIICNLPLETDAPAAGSCGSCGQCVKACPTGALLDDGTVDAGRCISYLTIEHGGAIDPRYWPLMGTRIFGCDACQDACPHNRMWHTDFQETPYGVTTNETPPGGRDVFTADVAWLDLADVLRWRQAEWDTATQGRALRRATFPMFLRNAAIAAGNSGDKSLVEPLEELLLRAEGELAFLRPVVKWALARLRQVGRAT